MTRWGWNRKPLERSGFVSGPLHFSFALSSLYDRPIRIKSGGFVLALFSFCSPFTRKNTFFRFFSTSNHSKIPPHPQADWRPMRLTRENTGQKHPFQPAFRFTALHAGPIFLYLDHLPPTPNPPEPTQRGLDAALSTAAFGRLSAGILFAPRPQAEGSGRPPPCQKAFRSVGP